MLLFGHVGFTLAAYAAIKRRQPFCFRTALLVGAVALTPDILDRILHLVIGPYPAHGVFHSILFYALALPLAFLFFRRLFEYPLIMAGSVVLDIPNTDLRALMYPLFGWTESLRGAVMDSPLTTFLDHHPKTIGYKIPTEHYLVFEVLGLVLILLVALKVKRDSISAIMKRLEYLVIAVIFFLMITAAMSYSFIDEVSLSICEG